MISCRDAVILCVLWLAKDLSTCSTQQTGLGLEDLQKLTKNAESYTEGGGIWKGTECIPTARESAVIAIMFTELMETSPEEYLAKHPGKEMSEKDRRKFWDSFLGRIEDMCPLRGELVCIKERCKLCDGLTEAEMNGPDRVAIQVACDEGTRIKEILDKKKPEGDSLASEDDIVWLKEEAWKIIDEGIAAGGTTCKSTDAKSTKTAGLLASSVCDSTEDLLKEGLSKWNVLSGALQAEERGREMCLLTEELVCVGGVCKACGGVGGGASKEVKGLCEQAERIKRAKTGGCVKKKAEEDKKDEVMKEEVMKDEEKKVEDKKVEDTTKDKESGGGKKLLPASSLLIGVICFLCVVL